MYVECGAIYKEDYGRLHKLSLTSETSNCSVYSEFIFGKRRRDQNKIYDS